ncbi:hypothetical protein GQ55_5G096600 [Panicum hallii var. hallii]|uniref:Uncharacterized protein n=1 Tax=Panicum hallii var. hallii TaxID=1504633 RepID=A0A2T7DEM3_9POAL|nr:hypothetical protein GQ55_5G096600 [Panicum hallii var. hallii]
MSLMRHVSPRPAAASPALGSARRSYGGGRGRRGQGRGDGREDLHGGAGAWGSARGQLRSQVGRKALYFSTSMLH